MTDNSLLKAERVCESRALPGRRAPSFDFGDLKLALQITQAADPHFTVETLRALS